MQQLFVVRSEHQLQHFLLAFAEHLHHVHYIHPLRMRVSLAKQRLLFFVGLKARLLLQRAQCCWILYRW